MRAVLVHRDFRLYWWGLSLSVLGDQLVITAIGLFVVGLTGSATDVGAILAAYSLPLVLLLPVGGVVADRLPRHRLIVATDVLRGVLHAVLAVLILSGTVEIWHMVVIGVLFGSAEAFFRPAATGLLPQTVPEPLIQQANATVATTREVAYFAGPALGTTLVLAVGGAAAFAFDALTFAVSALLLARIRPRPRGGAHRRSSVGRELREGWGAVRERAWVWATIAAFSVAVLASFAPFAVLGPVIAVEDYGEAAVYGIVAAATGAGTVTGALIALRWRPAFPMRAGMVAAALWPLGYAVYALVPPVPLACAAAVAGGVGGGLFAVWWETALAERIPPQLLSRVTAWDWMGSLALLPLGFLVAGPLGEALGEREVLLAGATLAAAAIAAGVLPRSTRTLQRLDEKSGRPSSVVEPSA